jgi:hypothetical protein
MDGRFKPTSTTSSRRSTDTVFEAFRGASTTFVTTSAAGAWLWACTLEARATIAALLISARRPTFTDVSRMASPVRYLFTPQIFFSSTRALPTRPTAVVLNA